MYIYIVWLTNWPFDTQIRVNIHAMNFNCCVCVLFQELRTSVEIVPFKMLVNYFILAVRSFTLNDKCQVQILLLHFEFFNCHSIEPSKMELYLYLCPFEWYKIKVFDNDFLTRSNDETPWRPTIHQSIETQCVFDQSHVSVGILKSFIQNKKYTNILDIRA